MATTSGPSFSSASCRPSLSRRSSTRLAAAEFGAKVFSSSSKNRSRTVFDADRSRSSCLDCSSSAALSGAFVLEKIQRLLGLAEALAVDKKTREIPVVVLDGLCEALEERFIESPIVPAERLQDIDRLFREKNCQLWLRFPKDPADAAQNVGFAGPVVDGAEEWERLAVVVQRLLLLAQIGVDSTDVV